MATDSPTKQAGAQVAQEILERRDPFGSEPLSHEFIKPLLAEAFAMGVVREAERFAESTYTRLAQLRMELGDE